MLWFFLIFSTLCWGTAEIFYKKGNTADEQYSHLKTAVFVGFFFGIYAAVILLTGNVSIKHLPVNFLRYLPVALCYIVSMVCSYFGVRYIEESISDPIENTSCAFVPVLCAVFLREELNAWTIAAVVIVIIGILGAGLFDREGKESRKRSYGKKLALLSIAMPFCYMVLDAVGTFLDIYYTDSPETTLLVGVTEENLEHTANCCYELTFLLAAIGILIFLKSRHVRFFNTQNGIARAIREQRSKIIAALLETGGQATYLFALSEGSGVAAVILGAGTVIVSFVLSRIILKEKLTALQYGFIAVIFAGIVMLSLTAG